jgi:hypothetical protein
VINGERGWLWRAAADAGEFSASWFKYRRNAVAAKRLLRKGLRAVARAFVTEEPGWTDVCMIRGGRPARNKIPHFHSGQVRVPGDFVQPCSGSADVSVSNETDKECIDEQENVSKAIFETPRAASPAHTLQLLVSSTTGPGATPVTPAPGASSIVGDRIFSMVNAAASFPKQRERVLTQRIEEAVVLLDTDSGKYYSLDEVGGRMWDLCDGTRTLRQLVAVICEEYEASVQVVEADVTELLTELTGENLVVNTF